MTQETEDPLLKELREIKATQEEVKQFMEQFQAPSDLGAGEQHYKQMWMSEHEGHVLGKEAVSFYQKQSLNFRQTVANTVLAGAMAQAGISNFYKWIAQGRFPYKFAVVVAAIAVMGYGLSTNVSFQMWLGEGYNAWGLMVFVIATLLIFAVMTRRRNKQPAQVA